VLSIKYFALYGVDGKLIQTMNRAELMKALRLNELMPGIRIHTFETKRIEVDQEIESVNPEPSTSEFS